jgi:hypothetical protein
MFSKASLDSFSGDFTDQTAVFKHLTGKSHREAQVELAGEAWGAGTPELPYPFDDLWKEIYDNDFPTEEAELLRKDLNEELGTEEFPAFSRSLMYGSFAHSGLRKSHMRKKFPNVTVPINEARSILLNFVNKQAVPLYGAIREKIREAAMSVARKFGAELGENTYISSSHLVETITRKTLYELKVEQARKAWDADPDPRIPYPAEEVFKIQDGGSLERALLDELNKKVVLPKYGFELDRLPLGFNANRVIMSKYFPNTAPLVSYGELVSRVRALIDAQKEPRIVTDINAAFQSSAREALLGLEEPDAKRVKNSS